MKPSNPVIVIVDEDSESLKETREGLENEYPDAIIMGFGSAYRVLNFVQSGEVSLLITELGFGDGYSGKNLIEDVRRHPKSKSLPIVVLTRRELTETEREELESFQVKGLEKPITSEVIKEEIGSLHEVRMMPAGPVKQRRLRAAEVLFKEGDRGDRLYILRSGKLQAMKSTPVNGKSELVKIAEILPGQLVGEMAFFDGAPRSLTVKALEDSVLIEVSTEEFKAALESQPVWLKILMESVLGRLRKTNEKLAESFVKPSR